MSELDKFKQWWLDKGQHHSGCTNMQFSKQGWQACAALKDARIAELEATNARLREMIENAPHGIKCLSIWHYMNIAPSDCTCWKREVGKKL